ncbi:MAG: hypothetical protein IT340_09545 [Chloroflexi bacterium]|nr:hypothetical protein [Chloroflexota bacterium]
MASLPPAVLLTGRTAPPTATRVLRAGPATMLLEGADLRYVRVAGREIVRRLYVAVRDHNWGTLPATISEMTVDQRSDGFAVAFMVEQRQGPIDFRWRGAISGAADGTLTYTMDGQAGSAFRYNRIGLCLLHPPETAAGRPYAGRTPDGPIAGTLPDLIGVQRIEGGQIFALFPAIDQLTIALAGGGAVMFDFEGDLFEMEDQRNWTDASFKTYSTPLALPFPKDAAPNQAIRQRLTITATGLPATEPAPAAGVRLVLGAGQGHGLPPIGLGMASHGQALAPAEVERLRLLAPAHLRVDLTPSDADSAAVLATAVAAATALGCPLELALFLAGDGHADLTWLATRLPGVPLARVLVFHAVSSGRGDEAISTGPLVAAARARLRPVVGDVPFAGGTTFYFTELNRRRPDPTLIDAVAYSINPQVHAFDERSLVETLLAQGETVRSARAFSGDRPIVVSPVTLKPRSNPNATGLATEPPPGELPEAVDPRQMSLFGAVWTAGSIAALAMAGAGSLTYYETTGWRGVMEVAAGSSAPAAFAAEPGTVFPLYHVLADVAEWRGGELVTCQSSDPLTAQGLAVRVAGGLRILAGNMTPEDQVVTLTDLPGETVTLRRLTTGTALTAMREPARFRITTAPATAPGGRLTVTLAPYELLRVEAPAG